MGRPTNTSLTSTEAVLQLPVGSFHEAIGLWVVGRSRSLLDPQTAVKRCPHIRGELGTPISHQSFWHAKSATQVERKASMQEAEEIPFRGAASSQREVRSIIVIIYT
jgi:hypothetical protein